MCNSLKCASFEITVLDLVIQTYFSVLHLLDKQQCKNKHCTILYQKIKQFEKKIKEMKSLFPEQFFLSSIKGIPSLHGFKNSKKMQLKVPYFCQLNFAILYVVGTN